MEKVWPTIGSLTVQPPKNEKTEIPMPMVTFTGQPAKNNFELSQLLKPQRDSNDNAV